MANWFKQWFQQNPGFSPSAEAKAALENDYPDELWQKASQIKLIATDVDGVLSPGTIIWTSQLPVESLEDDNQNPTHLELKAFNVKDGYGLRILAKKLGLQTAILTGRASTLVAHRAQELQIDHVRQGCQEKLPLLQTLCDELGLTLEQVAYVGDDLPDLAVLKAVGLSWCPADAVLGVRRACHWVSPLAGGQGVVRELVDLIWQAQSPGHASAPKGL